MPAATSNPTTDPAPNSSGHISIPSRIRVHGRSVRRTGPRRYEPAHSPGGRFVVLMESTTTGEDGNDGLLQPSKDGGRAWGGRDPHRGPGPAGVAGRGGRAREAAAASSTPRGSARAAVRGSAAS